jgi:hypothetical protein
MICFSILNFNKILPEVDNKLSVIRTKCKKNNIPIFINDVSKEIGICDFNKINVKSIGHLF